MLKIEQKYHWYHASEELLVPECLINRRREGAFYILTTKYFHIYTLNLYVLYQGLPLDITLQYILKWNTDREIDFSLNLRTNIMLTYNF